MRSMTLLVRFTEANIARDRIMDITLVGNPVMHHLLLGIDPIELGGAPFALASDDAVTLLASELDIHAHPGRALRTTVYRWPVGADTAGVILSEQPHLGDAITLVVDVGTNAEIVLGNSERLLACSSPTGPAFEGAQISSGQRAAPGAIERVRIDRETLEPRFKVIGSETRSDEPSFKDDVASTGVNGICGSGIIEVIAEMYLAGIITTDGVVRGNSRQGRRGLLKMVEPLPMSYTQARQKSGSPRTMCGRFNWRKRRFMRAYSF